MDIVSDLLVVTNMARKAIPQGLIGMAVLNRPRMTFKAGQLAVPGGRVIGDVDPWNLQTGFRGMPLTGCPMTVKTEPGQSLNSLWIIRCQPAMAAHASFVLRGEPWQDVSVFMTGTAFRFGRRGEVDLGLGL